MGGNLFLSTLPSLSTNWIDLVLLGLVGEGSQPVVLAEDDGGNAPEFKASFSNLPNKSPIVRFQKI